jgi:4-hydroxy-3-polyprenylbenzoate decarboxylase
MSKSLDQAQRLAAAGDLRRCLDIAAEIGELETIEGADPHLEMGALFELSLRQSRPPILLFRKIKGYPDDHRVVCNVRSSRVFNEGTGLELVQNYRKHRRAHSEPIPSEHVGDGPVFENVLMDNEVDILSFPAPKWHENDGGQYIGTECMVIAQDPESGWVNAGTYRVSVRDKRTLSIFIEPGKHADLIRKKWWARRETLPDGRIGRTGAGARRRGGFDSAEGHLRVRRRRWAARAGDQAGEGARHWPAVPFRRRTGLRRLHALR